MQRAWTQQRPVRHPPGNRTVDDRPSVVGFQRRIARATVAFRKLVKFLQLFTNLCENEVFFGDSCLSFYGCVQHFNLTFFLLLSFFQLPRKA